MPRKIVRWVTRDSKRAVSLTVTLFRIDSLERSALNPVFDCSPSRTEADNYSDLIEQGTVPPLCRNGLCSVSLDTSE